MLCHLAGLLARNGIGCSGGLGSLNRLIFLPA